MDPFKFASRRSTVYGTKGNSTVLDHRCRSSLTIDFAQGLCRLLSHSHQRLGLRSCDLGAMLVRISVYIVAAPGLIRLVL